VTFRPGNSSRKGRTAKGRGLAKILRKEQEKCESLYWESHFGHKINQGPSAPGYSARGGLSGYSPKTRKKRTNLAKKGGEKEGLPDKRVGGGPPSKGY